MSRQPQFSMLHAAAIVGDKSGIQQLINGQFCHIDLRDKVGYSAIDRIGLSKPVYQLCVHPYFLLRCAEKHLLTIFIDTLLHIYKFFYILF